MVKKTVNQDQPTIYHLFYGDEDGSPGHDLTFFEFPGVAPGKAGAGMVHRLIHRVGSDDTLDFWADRLGGEGIETKREGGSLVFADPEGLEHELAVFDVADPPLIAHAAEVPDEHALQGFEAVRSFTRDPDASRALLEEGSRSSTHRRRVGGARRGARRPDDLRQERRAWRVRRGHRPPRRVVGRHGRAGRLARARDQGAARTRRRSSTASGSARSTSASRAACCSSLPPADRGSRPTSRSRRSARRSRCRPTTSTCASSSSRS